jgi:hypothetical protein
VALQALKQAEAAEQQRAQSGTPPAQALSPTLQAAFRAIGHKLLNSGQPTSCRRRSARPYCAVSLTRS